MFLLIIPYGQIIQTERFSLKAYGIFHDRQSQIGRTVNSTHERYMYDMFQYPKSSSDLHEQKYQTGNGSVKVKV